MPALSRHPGRQRGNCLIILAVCFGIFVLAASIAIFFALRWAHKEVDLFTSKTPVTLPKAVITDADYQVVADRVAAFKTAMDQGQPTPPLILDERDLNAYLERGDPHKIGDKIYLTLAGSQVKGQVSFPLDALEMSWFKGRYLNGNVTLGVSLENGTLMVAAQQIEVNGKSPPESFMQSFRSKNLAEQAARDPKNAAEIAKIESIQIQDGKLVIKAKAQPDETAPAKP